MKPALSSLPPKPIAGPGRPDEYRTLAGDRVPSVTTITGRFKDGSNLIRWAYGVGYDDGFERKPKDANARRDAAGGAGHVAHQWIQDSIHGQPLTPYPYSDEETIDKARRALAAFQSWAERVTLRVVATEIPLVHETLGYGGTLDGLGVVKGAAVLLDWKTGNRTYPEHLVQLSAYRELLRDAAARAVPGVPALDLPVPAGGVLIRLDKETGEPHARELPSEALDLGWEFFRGALTLYELDKAIAKMVADRKKKGAAA
jgi:hypothetical protein